VSPGAEEPPAADHSAFWYDVVDDATLRQGDIFRGLTCCWPTPDISFEAAAASSKPKAELDFKSADFAIMSASCDVDDGKVPYVLLGLVLEASPETLRIHQNELAKRLEVLRQGLVPSQFLLSASEGISPRFPLSIVQFRLQALMPRDYLKRSCGSLRLRMRHPFREKFGNWVGDCFSRVGPENNTQIPQQTKIFADHVLRANAE
jgi:hypothetical protein